MLYNQVIFGPLKSRRLGVSLGINLLPTEAKVCTFNCIYCECGFNFANPRSLSPTRSEVKKHLTHAFERMIMKHESIDDISFAGNGEPTTHPDFEGIVNDTIALRDQYFPHAQLSVLSNATMVNRPSVVRALLKVDNNIQKLDAGLDDMVHYINQPQVNFSVAKTVEFLKAFKGQVIIQTLFLRGEYQGHLIDNTTPMEVEAWVKAIEAIQPKSVQLYSLDRATPVKGLEKIEAVELGQIAKSLDAIGIKYTITA